MCLYIKWCSLSDTDCLFPTPAMHNGNITSSKILQFTVYSYRRNKMCSLHSQGTHVRSIAPYRSYSVLSCSIQLLKCAQFLEAAPIVVLKCSKQLLWFAELLHPVAPCQIWQPAPSAGDCSVWGSFRRCTPRSAQSQQQSSRMKQTM